MIAPLLAAAGLAVLASLVLAQRLHLLPLTSPEATLASRTMLPENGVEDHLDQAVDAPPELSLDRVAAYANGTRKIMLLDLGQAPQARADWRDHRDRVEELLDLALASAATVPLRAAELRRECGVSGTVSAQYWEVPGPHGAAVLRVLRHLFGAEPTARSLSLGTGIGLLLDH